MREGKKPNWIYAFPNGSAELEESDPDAFWESFYEQLRHDDTSRNCQAAYRFFESRTAKGDNNVVRFLAKKLQNKEADTQARASTAALLCDAKGFEHNKFFAEHIISLLNDFQENRPNWTNKELQVEKEHARTKSDRYDFIGYPGNLNHIWIRFLVRNAPKYEGTLVKKMLDSKTDIMVRWVCIHALERHKLLVRHHGKCNKLFIRSFFPHLRNDDRRWNLLWATRSLIILDAVSRPHIAQRLNDAHLDDQEREVLRMIHSRFSKPKDVARFHSEYGDLACDIFQVEGDENAFQYELDIFQ